MKWMLFFSLALVSVSAQPLQQCDPQQCDAQLTKACDDYIIMAGQTRGGMCAIEQQGAKATDDCLHNGQPCDQAQRGACDTMMKNNPTMLACMNHQSIGTICRRKA